MTQTAPRIPVALVALALLALAAGLFWLFWRDDPAGPQGGHARGPAPVVVADVSAEEFVDRIEAVGTARARESVEITAQVTESVSALYFEDGDFVAEGAILVELTDAEEAAEIAAARATLADAEKQHDRLVDLVRRGTATRSRLDTALAARDAARARVEGLEARLADRIVRAPFTGLLGFRAVSLGTLVQPGDLITTLDDVSLIKLDFSIPETFLSALEEGLSIEARAAAYPGQIFTGRVKVVASRVNPVTRAVTVRAELENPDRRLRPGMLLTVDVFKDRRESPSIPEAALLPVSDAVYVFRVREDAGDGDTGSATRAERVTIRIGRRRPGRVEVVEGLEIGDRVVVEGLQRLRDGNPVKITGENVPDTSSLAGGVLGGGVR